MLMFSLSPALPSYAMYSVPLCSSSWVWWTADSFQTQVLGPGLHSWRSLSLRSARTTMRCFIVTVWWFLYFKCTSAFQCALNSPSQGRDALDSESSFPIPDSKGCRECSRVSPLQGSRGSAFSLEGEHLYGLSSEEMCNFLSRIICMSRKALFGVMVSQ